MRRSENAGIFVLAARLVLVWSLVPLLLLALAIPVTAQAPKGSPANPLRVGSIQIAGFAPVYMLEEIGARQGVSIEILDFTGTAERLAALLRGDIDLAFAGWTGLISLAAQGDPVVALAGAFTGGYTLTVRSDGPIQSVEDLRGKKVAYRIGSNAELYLLSQLEMAGLSLNDVEAVHMDFPQMPLALARGDIDAFFGSEPHSSIAIHDGYGRLLKYPYDVSFGGLNGVLVATRSFVEQHPEAVKTFLRLFVSATDYLNTFPDAYLETGMAMFQQERPVVELALKNNTLSYAVDTEAVEALVDWQLRIGAIEHSPDVTSFVDLSFLAEALTGR